LKAKGIIASQAVETFGDIKRLLPFSDESPIKKLQKIKNDIEPEYIMWKDSAERLRSLSNAGQINPLDAENEIMMGAKKLLATFNTTVKDTYKITDKPFSFQDMETVIQIGRDTDEQINKNTEKTKSLLDKAGENFKNIDITLGGKPIEYKQVDYMQEFSEKISPVLQQANEDFVNKKRSFADITISNNTIFNKVIPEFGSFYNKYMQDFDSIINRLKEDKIQLQDQ
jgi:hypothetical protein